MRPSHPHRRRHSSPPPQLNPLGCSTERARPLSPGGGGGELRDFPLPPQLQTTPQQHTRHLPLKPNSQQCTSFSRSVPLRLFNPFSPPILPPLSRPTASVSGPWTQPAQSRARRLLPISSRSPDVPHPPSPTQFLSADSGGSPQASSHLSAERFECLRMGVTAPPICPGATKSR
jgi:hypothetical protein